MELPKVQVEWFDSTREDGWIELEDAREREVKLIKSLGWLVCETAEAVAICHSVEGEQVLGLLHIPRGCIEKVTYE